MNTRFKRLLKLVMHCGLIVFFYCFILLFIFADYCGPHDKPK